MSNSPVSSKLKEEILAAYNSGWEEIITQAGIDAVAGSTGLETLLVGKETGNQPPTLKSAAQVSGLIGLNAGEIVGNICVMFSKEAILKIASTIFERDVVDIDRMVLDCVGELTNLTYGIFKRGASDKGYTLSTSLPNVILGSHDVYSLLATKFFKAHYTVAGHPMTITLSIDLGKN